jgi:small multidrug resistance pump
MPWILLSLAIGTEIAATVALKASESFSRLGPSVIVVVGYVVSFVLLARALKDLEVGVAYAIWSAAGTAIVAVLGIWLFDESAGWAKAFWIGVIIVGVVGLQVSSSASSH